MLPFTLVQKLYVCGFPYPWIIWEGKLWEDPENQPDLGVLIRQCGKSAELTLEKGVWTARSYYDVKYVRGTVPEVAMAELWLILPRSDKPRLAVHVDMPTDTF